MIKIYNDMVKEIQKRCQGFFNYQSTWSSSFKDHKDFTDKVKDHALAHADEWYRDYPNLVNYIRENNKKNIKIMIHSGIEYIEVPINLLENEEEAMEKDYSAEKALHEIITKEIYDNLYNKFRFSFADDPGVKDKIIEYVTSIYYEKMKENPRLEEYLKYASEKEGNSEKFTVNITMQGMNGSLQKIGVPIYLSHYSHIIDEKKEEKEEESKMDLYDKKVALADEVKRIIDNVNFRWNTVEPTKDNIMSWREALSKEIREYLMKRTQQELCMIRDWFNGYDRNVPMNTICITPIIKMQEDEIHYTLLFEMQPPLKNTSEYTGLEEKEKKMLNAMCSIYWEYCGTAIKEKNYAKLKEFKEMIEMLIVDEMEFWKSHKFYAAQIAVMPPMEYEAWLDEVLIKDNKGDK